MKPDLKNIKRNEIWLADLGQRVGSEQAGIRPVVIIQNNTGNHFSTTVIVASISSLDGKKAPLPTHVVVEAGISNLLMDSVIMLEQIRTIDKTNLIKRKGVLSSVDADRVDRALAISLAING